MSAVFFTPYWLSSHCSIVYLLNWEKKKTFQGPALHLFPAALNSTQLLIISVFLIVIAKCFIINDRFTVNTEILFINKCLICVIKYGSVESLIMSQ